MATTLTIYHPPSTELAIVDIDEKTIFFKRLMAEHKITAEFVYPSVLDIQIGDYITFDSENFYVNRLPDIIKLNETTYQYKIDFEGDIYELNKKLFLSSDGLADYSYNGTATDFITNIVAAMNVIGSGWSVGTVDTTIEKTLQFCNESCRSALMRVAQAFEKEFDISGKSISLVAAVGSTTALAFTYGRDQGLYKLTRQQVSDQNILTRVYGFGSTRNIPYTYRSGAKRLLFENAGVNYLEKNAATYGTIEGQYTNEDIYPSRTGTLSGASIDFDYEGGTGFNPKTSYIEDSAMDFDLNDYLIEGQVAVIMFKSGDLAGIECEIWKYDNTLKRFYINPYVDSNGYTVPFYNGGSEIQPEIGDTYTLLGISLPVTYVDAAETALQAATQAYLDENSVPMVVYSVEIDKKFAKVATLDLHAGDKVTIVDTALGINSLIRVSAIQFPLVNIYDIKATIADFVPYTLQERIIKTSISTKQEAIYVDRRSAELSRRNTFRQNQLRELLFDTDGYFDPVNIKPLSIETSYLSVGAKSRNYILNGIKIEPNYQGNKNKVVVSAGSLIHWELNVSGNYVWTIASGTSRDDMVDATPYYFYLICSQTANTGIWNISDTKKKFIPDTPDGNYYFLVGILYPVLDGVRDFEFTNGMTYINGRTITTGKIQSLDTLNYLDLDANKFRVGDANNSFDWNVTTANVLTIKGALVQSPGATTFPLPCFRGAYDAGTTYYKGDQVTYGGSSWLYVNATEGSGHTPAEDAYWDKVASIGSTGATGETGATGATGATGPAGADGADGADGTDGSSPAGVYRGAYNASTPYYGNSKRRDIVKYTDDLYYIATLTAGDAFTGHAPGETAYWESFGASFDSVATNLLFAALAYVDNLGVKYFNGVPVPAGNLSGSVVNTTPNTPAIYSIELTGTSGEINILVNGISKPATFVTTLADAAIEFISAHSGDFAGVTVTNPSGAIINFSGGITSLTVQPVSGDMDGIRTFVQSGIKRKDTITLSGSSGRSLVTCDGVSNFAIWNDNGLSDTAADFVVLYATAYLAGGVVLTSDGEDLIFTAQVAGAEFSGDTTITNVANSWRGSIKMQGNEIWNDDEDNDTYGFITINRKGYDGGVTRYRHLLIGNGKGGALMTFMGGVGAHGSINMACEYLTLSQIPTSSTGLSAGMVYNDSGTLKIKL